MRGRGPATISPENGLSRYPVLRVCRRRQAGNPDDSTHSHKDTPSGPHTMQSKHEWRGSGV
jgi:hypothetical protein